MRSQFGLIFVPGRRYLMTWTPKKIDWLALGDEKEFERAIGELLGSNPVLSGKLTRPTGHRGLRDLYNEVSGVIQRELEKALLNPGAYHSSDLVHTAVVDGVSKHLIISHYLFLLFRCRPKPAYCPIAPGQVWFPASYLIVKGRTVFDWQTGAPQRSFYDPATTIKRRRPAITLSADKDGLYTLVPVSHVGGGASVKVDLGRGLAYACCFFAWRASWSMLHGDRGAANASGLRLRRSEFDEVLQATKRKGSS